MPLQRWLELRVLGSRTNGVKQEYIAVNKFKQRSEEVTYLSMTEKTINTPFSINF